MINILLQIIATLCVIAAISGVKMMDLPALPTFLLVFTAVISYLFVLAGGLSRKKNTK
jgi:hypothetical protein